MALLSRSLGLRGVGEFRQRLSEVDGYTDLLRAMGGLRAK